MHAKKQLVCCIWLNSVKSWQVCECLTKLEDQRYGKQCMCGIHETKQNPTWSKPWNCHKEQHGFNTGYFMTWEAVHIYTSKNKTKNQKEAKPYCLHGLEWCCVDIDATTVRSFGNRLEHRRLWGCRENCRGWRLLRQRHGGLLSREGTIHITLKTVSKISHDCNEHFPTFQWKNYSIYKEFKN